MIVKGLSIIALAVTIIFAAIPDLLITGIVNDGENPLEGAIVSLVSDSTIADTSDADGKFRLATITAISEPNLRLKNDLRTTIKGTSLYFTLSGSVQKAEISLYNGIGKRVMYLPLKNLAAQTHHVTLPALSPGYYLLSMKAGELNVNQQLICIGSSSYLSSSGKAASFKNAALSKQVPPVDGLKVTKNGYVTKMYDIAEYQIENLQITLQKQSEGPCIDGKWATTDVSKMGPFETVSENVTGAVLYRPKEMSSGCLYPVITWGHGAGGSPSNYETVLKMMASHGFVVIASTAGNVQDGGSSANQFRNKMVEVAQWVVEQSRNSSSVLYQKIDTTKIGASGHSQGGYGASEAGQNPLIRTSVSISGAVGSSNQKGPAFIICGGQDPYSGAKCEDHPTGSYNGTSGVPVFFGKCLNADHGNWGFEMMMSDKSKPHDVVQATIAWFRYHLMGDEEYRLWFYGSDCFLSKHSNWSVKSKGMD